MSDEEKPLSAEERAEAVRLCEAATTEVHARFPFLERGPENDPEVIARFNAEIPDDFEFFARSRTLLPRYEATVRERDERIKALEGEVQRLTNREDICGLCGLPGADKFPHPEHWPGERVPDSELVHADCERIECERAHAALTDEQRKRFLRSI